jgi:ABC-2 type transport system permease protein
MRWKTILRLECRNLSSGPALWIGCGALLAAVAYGIWNGAAWTSYQHSPMESSSPAPSDDPFVLSTREQFAVLPPGPLSLLCVGDSELRPPAAKVLAWSTPGSLFAQTELHNPANLRAGRFDAAFIMVYLLPLFILSLSFDLVSAEREGGTLALIRAHPASLACVLLLKTLPRAVVTWAMVWLCGLGAASIIPGTARLRLVLWILAVCLYAAFWIVLALAINFFGYGSSTNAVILVGCWIVLAIVTPALIDNFIQAKWPLPPPSEIILAAEQAELDYSRDRQTAIADLLREHPEYRPASGEMPGGRQPGVIAAFLREQPALDAVEQRHREAIARRESAAEKLLWLSPVVALQLALADLAGSGAHRSRYFRRQVDNFIRKERAYYFPMVLRGEKATAASSPPPRFHYDEEPFTEVADRVAAALGCIGAFLSACLIASFRSLRARSSA